MAELIAEGGGRRERWRRPIPSDRSVILGRGGDAWSVAWDNRVSRRHAELRWVDDRLEVKKLKSAKNPLFWRGAESESFTVTPGDHFVIGKTTFRVEARGADLTCDRPQPRHERTFSGDFLRNVAFQQAHEKLDILSRLPDLIADASHDDELATRLVEMLLDGIRQADAVALIDHATAASTKSDPEIICWDRRDATSQAMFPSRRLVQEAATSGESVAHSWSEHASDYSETGGADWAFCTPLIAINGRRWLVYVAGESAAVGDRTLTEGAELTDDLKFTEIVASTVSSLRRLRHLERQQAHLSAFFAPSVLDAMKGADAKEVLQPRESEMSVLFCDLRGFSRESEQHADDLFGVLDRVSRALGIATRHVMTEGGVVGDFHGDAVMGFWGWPFAQSDAAQRACRAALAIRAEFGQGDSAPDSPAAGFDMGIGIATGTAVAGRIGTADQAKISAFGPVVNLAARLESMTKTVRAGILMDQATATIVRSEMSANQARCRRLAVVRPAGLTARVEIHELLPPHERQPWLSDDHISRFEEAVEGLLSGHWHAAMRCLHDVPPEDQAKDFLTVYIAQHNRVPPPNWDGCIPLTDK